MKIKLQPLLWGVLSLVVFNGCEKGDKPDERNCQVEQFETTKVIRSLFNPPVTVPYIFKKTFDVSGRVKAIDVNLYSFAAGAFHNEAAFFYRGQTVYALQAQSRDTLMVITLNPKGRITRVEEKSGLFFNSVPANYAFTYDAQNKLASYVITSTAYPPTVRQTVGYDANGNCIRIGDCYFAYDYTRTARTQFYSDVENFSTPWQGFQFLEFLGFFPEITNPSNVRIFSKWGNDVQPIVQTALTDHTFDNRGRLTSYKYLFGPAAAPIIYNCDHGKGQP